MREPILWMFGGESAEHEVSVVTGLQALEHLDRERYEPHVIYVTKQGRFEYIPNLVDRGGFLARSRVKISFGRDTHGGFFKSGLLGRKIYPRAAYLAFHGGTGESGQLQGMLESLGIPHSGARVEGAAITMNKALTKEVLAAKRISLVPSVRLFAEEIRKKPEEAVHKAITTLSLPLIVKPAHLGSSIGISVAKTEVELQKALMAAAFSDMEILVEKFLEGITEYNCAVRLHNGLPEASEVEKPVSRDEILSFADKYERSGKKTGNGMASLVRELPAKISTEFKQIIQDTAKRAFAAARLSGMARIDFMQEKNGMLYLTEINPIPGSMAFYLWEASGIPFKQQITELIEEARREAEELAALNLEYSSDIIERFVRRI